MTAEEARERVTEARELLSDAMRELSVPHPDLGAASLALVKCSWACRDLALELVSVLVSDDEEGSDDDKH